MLLERNCKILALCALLLSAAGTVGATAPKGVFSVGNGVYVTLADENYSQSTKTFFTFDEAQAISVAGWHVLSKSEWTYLLVTRDAGLAAADQRNGIGTVAGKHGLIIIPDNWTQPAGVPAFTAGAAAEGWDTNIYDATQWAAMEAAGAAFLPAAGYSTDGTTATDAGDDGTYWSSSENSDNTVQGFAIQFEKSVIHNRQSRDKSRYYSVRLAQTVTVLDENDDASTFSTKFAAADDEDYALMIRWTSGDDLSFLKFDNIAWGTGSDADQTGDAKVTFRGFYPMTTITYEDHYNLFLGADDVLYWPISDGKSMKGFRAYWLVDPGQPSPAPIYHGMPASLHIRQKTGVTTGLENEEMKTKSDKILREGRVVLLINGEQYSIGGQKL